MESGLSVNTDGSRGEELAPAVSYAPCSRSVPPQPPVYLYCTNLFLQLGLGKVPPWFPWASPDEGKFTGKLMG